MSKRNLRALDYGHPYIQQQQQQQQQPNLCTMLEGTAAIMFAERVDPQRVSW